MRFHILNRLEMSVTSVSVTNGQTDRTALAIGRLTGLTTLAKMLIYRLNAYC